MDVILRITLNKNRCIVHLPVETGRHPGFRPVKYPAHPGVLFFCLLAADFSRLKVYQNNLKPSKSLYICDPITNYILS
jgi:hypothetical protein